MNAAPSPESVGRAVLERLGVAEDPMIGADPVSFLRSLAAAGASLVKNPAGTAAANGRLAIGLAGRYARPPSAQLVVRRPARWFPRPATSGSPTRHTRTTLCSFSWFRSTC